MVTKFNVPDYGMFSKRGNAVIHGIVIACKIGRPEWTKVREMLSVIARDPGLGEATDTMVREIVYGEIYGE